MIRAIVKQSARILCYGNEVQANDMTTLARLFDSYCNALYRRSLLVAGFFHRHMGMIVAAWLGFTLLAGTIRFAIMDTPVYSLFDAMPVLVGYGAVILAPLAGYAITRSAFWPESAHKPLDFHLSFVGKWRKVDPAEARSMELFGPAGFLASLLIGLMLNVVVRTGEYFVAIPALSLQAPDWSLALFAVMTADLVVMNFFYMVAFVMALRNVPLFPRMLLFAWLMDILMQLVIAHRMAGVDGLPAEVVAPLVQLLQGNLTKVLISVAVWMPYIILSQRVNLTYRSRVPVPAS